MKLIRYLLFLFILLFEAAPLVAQNRTNTGGIYGKVLDIAGSPLKSVQVSLESKVVPPVIKPTSDDGNFRFLNLPPGSYSLTFLLNGYSPEKRKDIVVSIGSRVQVNVFLEISSNSSAIIFGKVMSKNSAPLDGVSVTLKSEAFPQLQTKTGSDGSFRFENLSPGSYSVIFKKENYLERQDSVELPAGGTLELPVQLVPKPVAEGAVFLGVPERTGAISWTYSRDYLRQIPNSDSIYALLEQTPAVDLDLIRSVHSDPASSGFYARVFTRGTHALTPVWNYDGLNISLPEGFPTFFSLENAEEVQIITAGNDISTPTTSGITVNVIPKQGGREWHGSGTFFFSNDGLQSTNTPEEIVKDPRVTSLRTDRLGSFKEYSFDLGGPVVQDKVFIWGALHQGWIDRTNFNGSLVDGINDANQSTSYSLKTNLNLSSAHQIQFGYFRADHRYRDPGFVEVLEKPQTIPPGVITAQYDGTLDPETFLVVRYGYVGGGRTDSALDYGTFLYSSSSEQAAHNVSIEADRLVENVLAGDHELRFGLEARTTGFRDSANFFDLFSLQDDNPEEEEPLTEGVIHVSYPSVPKTTRITRVSLYADDSYRKGRLALNLGLRFDRQTGKSASRTYPSPLDDFERPDFLGPGFEELLPPVDYPELDPGIAYDNFSPRIGATFNLLGDGRLLIYGNIARYYQPYLRNVLLFSDVPVEFSARYENQNDDRVITPDELVNGSPFSVKDALSNFLYDSDVTNSFVNEYAAGIQTRVFDQWSISAAFTHRAYHDFHVGVPFDLTPDDFQELGTTELNTPFGDFLIHRFALPGFINNGTTILRNNRTYTQMYDSLELMLERVFVNNYMLRGGLVFQKQRGHHYGEDLPPFFIEEPTTSYLAPSVNYGVLEDQGYTIGGSFYPEWEVKVSGAYRFPWQFSVGAFLRYQQGHPHLLFGREPFVFFFPGSAAPSGIFFVEPIGERRLDNIFTVDLRLNQEIHVNNYGSLDLILEIFNATNSNAVFRRGNLLGSFDENSEFHPNQNLNVIQQYMSPRVVRLGFRFSF